METRVLSAGTNSKLDRLVGTRLFNARSVLLWAGGFAPAVLIANRIVRAVHQYGVDFDCPPYWPIGIGYPRVPHWTALPIAALCLIVLHQGLRILERSRYRMMHVICLGLVLILGTTFMQGWTYQLGWDAGFVNPIAGMGQGGIQHYHDALAIENPITFLREYVARQPTLLEHSRTHPPGAALTMYALSRLVVRPALISVTIAIVSVLLIATCLRSLLSRFLRDEKLSGYVTLIMLLVPAVQIYSAASLDALIAGLAIGVVALGTGRPKSIQLVGAFACLLLLSFMTFAALFAMPVLLGFELWRTRTFWRSGLIAALVALVYWVMAQTTGFNYVECFRTAASLENPDGWRLFAEPVSFCLTRIEGLAEIILFFGPFLTVIAIRGLRKPASSSSELRALTWLGVGTLTAMFLTGAFRTGETARTCLFIYPYLLMPVAGYLGSSDADARERRILAGLVFAQTLLMQMFGAYFW